MAGHLNGLASQIRREEPKALFVHCLAHSVNLCLQDCAKSSRPVRDALALVKESYNLIQLSPKRLAWFNRLKDKLAPENPTLKLLCPTRWTVRSSAIDAVLKNYALLYSTKAAGQSAIFGCGQFRTFRPGFGFGQRYHVDRHGQLTLKQLRLSVLNEVHTNS